MSPDAAGCELGVPREEGCTVVAVLSLPPVESGMREREAVGINSKARDDGTGRGQRATDPPTPRSPYGARHRIERCSRVRQVVNWAYRGRRGVQGWTGEMVGPPNTFNHSNTSNSSNCSNSSNSALCYLWMLV